MSGTAKRIAIATLEQAKHTDLTRAVQFGASTLGEVLRGLFDDQQWPTSYPGLVKRSLATATPLKAHVLSGLMIEPDEDEFLTITPGALLALITPADDDDSIVQIIDDPGVQDTGTLTFTTNPAGSGIRLDIVECQIVDTMLEEETRGIFNETTRNFDPTLTPKVKAPQLGYRIRTGIAGGGMPALASGWLPLAVINVQEDAVGFSTCDIWDVRPLVADRVRTNEPVLLPDGSTVRSVRSPVRGVAGIQGSLAGAENGARGYVAGSFGGYIAGGELRTSVATAAANFGGADYDENFILNGSHVQSPGGWSAPAAGDVYFLAVLFPAGLPRWVKYVQDPDPTLAKRVPKGPRGITVYTTTQPNSGGYYSALNLPTACGFTAAAPGICLMAGAGGIGFALRDNYTSLASATAIAVGGLADNGTDHPSLLFDTTNTNFPKHATELELEIGTDVDADGLATITVLTGTGLTVYAHTVRLFTAFDEITRVRIPLFTGEADGADANKTKLLVTTSGAACNLTAKVVGWATF